MQLSYSDDDCTVVIQKNIEPTSISLEELLEEFIKPLFKCVGWDEAIVNALIVAEKVDKKKVN